ncbi:MAG: NAD(+) synthase, partial [Firmicutes bacterium]|nr:NAD(+) synthase [Bacillota bacterium]
MKGLIKLAAASPVLLPGRFAENGKNISACIAKAHAAGAAAVVFPWLALSGGVADLTLPAMYEAAEDALLAVAAATKGRGLAAAVSLPMMVDGRKMTATAVLSGGAVAAVIPDTQTAPCELTLGNARVPCGFGLLLRSGLFDFAIVAGRCMADAASKLTEFGCGAQVVLCPLLNPEKPGLYAQFLAHARSLSETHRVIIAAAGISGGGAGDVYMGASGIFENGKQLPAEASADSVIYAEADTDYITYARSRAGMSPAPCDSAAAFVKITAPEVSALAHKPFKTPFVPPEADFDMILNALAAALYRRMNYAKAKTLVLGVSGGSDSACALLVAAHMCKRYGIKAESIVTVTMNTVHTSAKSRKNAQKIIQCAGTTHIDIPITDAVARRMAEIRHSEQDTVYENIQARERAAILLALGNKYNGLVMGTS